MGSKVARPGGAASVDWIAIDQRAAGSCRLEFCFAKEGPMFTLERPTVGRGTCPKMMDRLGLDTDAFTHRRFGLDLSSSIRTCQFCDADEVCRDWLARAAKALAETSAFCPNAAMLFAQAR